MPEADFPRTANQASARVVLLPPASMRWRSSFGNSRLGWVVGEVSMGHGLFVQQTGIHQTGLSMGDHGGDNGMDCSGNQLHGAVKIKSLQVEFLQILEWTPVPSIQSRAVPDDQCFKNWGFLKTLETLEVIA